MSKTPKKKKNLSKNQKKGREKNGITLALQFEEIILRSGLSSPPRFRIQGGWSERHRRSPDGGRKSWCLILDIL